MSNDINYAAFFGFHSVAAAVVFAVLYVPLSAWFIHQSIRRPTYVFVVMAVFCTIRITAYTIRALLAGQESLGENLSLLIADEILFGVGFFGLLYSAYTLVLDRESLLDVPKRTGIISRLTRSRRIFRLAMTIAIVLGITGTSEATSSNPSTVSTAHTLRKISTIIFLVLTVLQAYQTMILVRSERSVGFKNGNDSWGAQHGGYILYIISLLLLVREAFLIATIGNQTRQNDEAFWYPLVATPEVIAAMMYAIPGLVPPRSELPQVGGM
ncbi:hypothetical protein B0H10DRAFT_2222894 [Mycena sp. CBHHK59/15]|nr:hypothetical protein B0H10DRAFT_2222894 [Mycena sp. CBHHK59/15]